MIYYHKSPPGPKLRVASSSQAHVSAILLLIVGIKMAQGWSGFQWHNGNSKFLKISSIVKRDTEHGDS
jgi:hypothetical protein